MFTEETRKKPSLSLTSHGETFTRNLMDYYTFGQTMSVAEIKLQP